MFSVLSIKQEIAIKDEEVRRYRILGEGEPGARQLKQDLLTKAEDKSNLRKEAFDEFKDMLAKSDDSLLKAAAVSLKLHEIQAACDFEVHKDKDAWNRQVKRQGKMKKDIGICLQIRNDAKILDEYIAFHWIQVSWLRSTITYLQAVLFL